MLSKLACISSHLSSISNNTNRIPSLLNKKIIKTAPLPSVPSLGGDDTKATPSFPLPSFPSLGDAFKIIKEPCSECSAVVVKADTKQDGVNIYIALDSDSYCHNTRPGNGGIRLLNYESTKSAIDDAVRLAKGMTRKHDMFRTGFSGAKVVVDCDHDDLNAIDRNELMKDVANALHAFEGGMLTGCDLNTCDVSNLFVMKFYSGTY